MSYNNGNALDRYKFSGKELDQENGLNKYHAVYPDVLYRELEGLLP